MDRHPTPTHSRLDDVAAETLRAGGDFEPTAGAFAIGLMDGATKGARSLAYVTHTLVTALTAGDMVVIDDLATHEVAGVRRALETGGIQLRCEECDKQWVPVGRDLHATPDEMLPG